MGLFPFKRHMPLSSKLGIPRFFRHISQAAQNYTLCGISFKIFSYPFLSQMRIYDRFFMIQPESKKYLLEFVGGCWSGGAKQDGWNECVAASCGLQLYFYIDIQCVSNIVHSPSIQAIISTVHRSDTFDSRQIILHWSCCWEFLHSSTSVLGDLADSMVHAFHAVFWEDHLSALIVKK